MKNKIIIPIVCLVFFCLVSTIVLAANNVLYGRNESNPFQMIPILLTSNGTLKTEINFSITDKWNTNIGLLDDINMTQFNNVGEFLTLNESWLTTFGIESGWSSGGGAGDKWVDGGDYIYPNSTFADNVMIQGWLNVTSWLEVWADTVIHGDLNVTENLYVTGNITGNQLFVSSAIISGNIDISGNTTITGNADISGDTNISGNQSLTGDLTIGGKVSDDNSSSYTFFNENGTFVVHLES